MTDACPNCGSYGARGRIYRQDDTWDPCPVCWDAQPVPAEPTYTASEVKVLTEAALRQGRKEAADEIAAAIRRSLSMIIDLNYPEVLIPRETAIGLAREIGTRPSQPSGAVSDERSGGNA